MLHIARTLFWKNGYHATSMRDLAKEYGCKPANIYNFFPNKEEILYEVLLEEMLQIIEPIRHLEDDEITDPVQQLHIIIESHLEVTLSYRRSAKTLFDVTLDNLSPQKRKEIVGLRDTYDRIIRKVIQRGIDSGLFRGTDAKLVSFMIASMITRTRIWFHPKKGVTVAELAEFIFQFSLNGLKGEKLSQPE
jgi:AcrR family transcriptional regulator